MQHLYVFYFILTFSLGAISLGVAITLYLRTKDEFLQYYLYFYTPFTLLVILNVLLFYIRFNVPEINIELRETLEYLEHPVALYLVMVTVPVFVHYLASVPHASIPNILFGTLAILMLISYHVFESLSTAHPSIGRVGELLEDTIFVGVMLYSLISGARYSRKQQEPFKKRFGKIFFILFVIFFPGIISDTFLSEVTLFRFYPILYCSFSLVLTYQFLRHYHDVRSARAEQLSEVTLPAETFFDHYKISAREKEVIVFIVQGQNNQQIGETLCISLNTVKTHVRNIYQKLKVNSRQELIALLDTHAQEFPPQN